MMITPLGLICGAVVIWALTVRLPGDRGAVNTVWIIIGSAIVTASVVGLGLRFISNGHTPKRRRKKRDG